VGLCFAEEVYTFALKKITTTYGCATIVYSANRWKFRTSNCRYNSVATRTDGEGALSTEVSGTEVH